MATSHLSIDYQDMQPEVLEYAKAVSNRLMSNLLILPD